MFRNRELAGTADRGTEGQHRCAENRTIKSTNKKQATFEITSCAQLFLFIRERKQWLIGSFTGSYRYTDALHELRKSTYQTLAAGERDNLFKHKRSQIAEADARELTSGGLLGWLAEMLHTASDVTDTAKLIDIESASSTASGLVEIVSTSNQAARCLKPPVFEKGTNALTATLR